MHTVKWLSSSIQPRDETLTGTTALGQSGPGSNGNEGVLYIPQSLRTEVSLSDGLVSSRTLIKGGCLPHCRDSAQAN